MVQLHPVVPILAGRCRAHGRKRLGYRNALNEAPQAARCNCGCDGQPRGSILRQAARHGPPLRRLGRAQAHFPARAVQSRPAAPPVCVLGILGIPPNRMADIPMRRRASAWGLRCPPICRVSSTAEQRSSKPRIRVRFPRLAPLRILVYPL